MIAIVLCPGPSFANYVPQPADVIIGVNRAALIRECDWWAALDYPQIRDNVPKLIGNPKLLSRGQTVNDLGASRLIRFGEIRLIEDFEIPLTSPLSAEAAVLFAAHLGARHIKVFGADWCGTQDYDGREAGEDRTEKRWARERKNWETVIVPFLSEKRVIVERL